MQDLPLDQRVSAQLKNVFIADTKVSLAQTGIIESTDLTDGTLTISLALPLPAASQHAQLKTNVSTLLGTLDGVAKVAVSIRTNIPAYGVQRGLKPLPEITNIVAVASGKGGVGKSTTAVNLALALAAEGASVGVLDADIYGPSIPRMLGLVGERPSSPDGKHMLPLRAHGLQVMSVGFLVDEAKPMVWRGPMVTQALNQLMLQTAWESLDYLIVDMPPGTGDIQLTLTQKVPVAGAIIVTTPQDIALADARKGLEMFRKVSVPVLGIVENMSVYQCPNCGERASLFGEGGGERLAGEAQTKLLGELPLRLDIREQADSGCPTVAHDPDGEVALIYRAIAMRAAAELALSRRDYARAFPNIVVEDS